MMSEPNEATERNQPDEPVETAEQADSTDRLEGSYTEVDGEAPHERTVAGEYTRTEGVPDEESVVDDYTSTAEHPETHDASEQHGKFFHTDAKPHPGLHHA
jgi:hypothetical protein